MKRRLRRSQRRARTLAVFVAVSVVGLQALAISRVFCTPQSVERWYRNHTLCPPRLWPFLDYPMYKQVHRVGTRVERNFVVVRTRDGATTELFPERLDEREEADAAVAALGAKDVAALKTALMRRFDLETLAIVELHEQTLVLARDGFRADGARITARLEFGAVRSK